MPRSVGSYVAVQRLVCSVPAKKKHESYSKHRAFATIKLINAHKTDKTAWALKMQSSVGCIKIRQRAMKCTKMQKAKKMLQHIRLVGSFLNRVRNTKA